MILLAAAAALTPTLIAPPPAATQAAALDKSLVAPDARWVAHFDVGALARSELLRLARSGEHSIKVNIDEALSEVRTELGLDPLEDVRSVTLYGASTDDEQLVVQVLATAQLDEALTELELRGEVQTMDVGGRTFRRMGPEKAHDTMYSWVHPRGADRLLVLTGDVDRLSAAARRVESQGREPSLLTTQRGALAASPRPGSIFFAAVDDSLAQLAPDVQPASRVVEMARGAVLDLGEAQGMVFGVATLQTDDSEAARKVGDVLRGATSLVGLMAASSDVPAGLTQLVEALSFETSGTSATVRFEYDVRRLLSDLTSLEESEEF